jgi:hypothetical protein
MGQDMIRGKSLTAVARDIADGYSVLNPLTMKNFSTESYRDLYQQLRKVQKEVRMEKFPFHEMDLIRKRNMRLQRLHQALNVLQNAARLKRIILA